jgi:hypothetical protein
LRSENFIYRGCNAITEINIHECPWLMDLNFKSLPLLSRLTIENCDNLIEFNCAEHETLNELNLQKCKNLQKIILNDMEVLEELDLSRDLPSLSDVNLSGSANLKRLKLAKKTTEEPQLYS